MPLRMHMRNFRDFALSSYQSLTAGTSLFIKAFIYILGLDEVMRGAADLTVSTYSSLGQPKKCRER